MNKTGAEMKKASCAFLASLAAAILCQRSVLTNTDGEKNISIAIGKGGIIPSVFLHQKLKIPIETIWINFRDKTNKPIRKEPVLIKTNKLKILLNSKNSKGLEKSKIFQSKNKKILLVDDVSRTGKTLEKAKNILKGNKIKTFVVNGKADYSLFNKEECIEFPWR